MMFEQFPILSFITFLPLVGAFLVMMMRGEADAIRNNVVNVGAFVSFSVFVLSLAVLFQFDKTSADFQFVEEFVWFDQLNLTYKMGVDGISIFFVMLSTLLIPLCILLCKHSVQSRIREYVVALLVLETLMI